MLVSLLFLLLLRFTAPVMIWLLIIALLGAGAYGKTLSLIHSYLFFVFWIMADRFFYFVWYFYDSNRFFLMLTVISMFPYTMAATADGFRSRLVIHK